MQDHDIIYDIINDINMDIKDIGYDIIELIWNPVHLVYGGTRQSVLVHPGTYASGDMAVRETSFWYVPVCTDIENSWVRMYRDVPVCTVLYCHGTRWYKVVQGGT
jgi:hypothetical protein